MLHMVYVYVYSSHGSQGLYFRNRSILLSSIAGCTFLLNKEFIKGHKLNNFHTNDIAGDTYRELILKIAIITMVK